MAAHHEDELVIEHRDELGVLVLDRPADSEIDLASEHHLEDLFGMSGAHAHPDVRVRRLERLQKGRQDVRAHRRRRGDEELADLSEAQIVHGLLSLEDLRDRALRVGEQGTSRVGERHPARASDEEVDAELPLEAL